jgi:hypothetical protein
MYICSTVGDHSIHIPKSKGSNPAPVNERAKIAKKLTLALGFALIAHVDHSTKIKVSNLTTGFNNVYSMLKFKLELCNRMSCFE